MAWSIGQNLSCGQFCCSFTVYNDQAATKLDHTAVARGFFSCLSFMRWVCLLAQPVVVVVTETVRSSSGGGCECMISFGLLTFRRLKPIAVVAMQQQAEQLIMIFRRPGSPVPADRLDYSAASLAFIDEYLLQFYLKQTPLPCELLEAVSAYVFEVARRQFGGVYLSGDAKNPFALLVGEPEFQLGMFFVEKIRRRALYGADDSIVRFYAEIAAKVQAGVNAIHGEL